MSKEKPLERALVTNGLGGTTRYTPAYGLEDLHVERRDHRPKGGQPTGSACASQAIDLEGSPPNPPEAFRGDLAYLDDGGTIPLIRM